MPIATPLTALLGIKHPVLSAPMDVIAGARLTMAVSAAGGFGILGGGYGDQEWLSTETARLKGFRHPFGIGFITWSFARRPELLDIALAAKPRAIMLSFGDPAPFAPRIKAAGALLVCQVQSEDMARQALAAGADCPAVLQQLAAVRGAVNGLMATVLESYLREEFPSSAVRSDSQNKSIDETVSIVRSYLR